MEIVKEANAGSGRMAGPEDLALINELARRELKAEEVYTFQLRLCDNEIDREWERFPRKTLEELAGMFVGRSGIFDHSWSATGQTARIYRTEVVEEEQVTRAGDRACFLKAWAYMLRTEGGRELIEEIEGGIKKEVSVGCAVEKAVCSVCGQEMGQCRHVKGRTYNGKLCWAELTGAKDAYEWSFVAVPAQRRAGVMKGLSPTLRALTRQMPEARRELEELEKAAGLGRRYLEELRGEVARLAAIQAPELEVGMARSMVWKLDEEELRALMKVLGDKGGKRWGQTQLSYGEKEAGREADGAFLV